MTDDEAVAQAYAEAEAWTRDYGEKHRLNPDQSLWTRRQRLKWLKAFAKKMTAEFGPISITADEVREAYDDVHGRLGIRPGVGRTQ